MVAPDSPVRTDSPLVRVCRGVRSDIVPVWFMRQAGRYNPRHRELYEKHGVRGLTTNPELNARVTCLPVEELGVDAAIMYADIILPMEDMGIKFEYGSGDVGPLIENPIQDPSDVNRLRPLEPRRGVPYILEAIQGARARLPEDVPLIGFCGGPFTLAGYIIEGAPSRTFPRTKQFMYTHPKPFRELLELLTQSMSRYLNAQIQAGVDVLQVFESWMGALSPEDYQASVASHTRTLFESLQPESIPTMYFGTSSSALLKQQVEAGADVIGVDWRISLSQVARRIGTSRPIMGNLEPATLLAPFDVLREKAETCLQQGRAFPGHIFNLGHRVPNRTGVDQLRRLVDLVHAWTPSQE